MAALYFILAILIQNSLTETILEDADNSIESGEDFNVTYVNISTNDNTSESYSWIDSFIESSSTLFPSPSATLMTQVTNSDKSPEEKIENIKEIVNQIASSIQNEMDNLLSDAMTVSSNEETDNKLRKKRSIETPMDSTQLLNRLLNHIIANNEYQNDAIKKLMSAQELADKYGITFSPDPDTLSDLALAAHEQANEMSSILKDAMDLKNVTQNESTNESINSAETKQVESAEELIESMAQTEYNQKNSSDYILNFEIPKENNLTDHPALSNYNYYNYCPVETQIISPVPQDCYPPVTQWPSFYDFVLDTSPLDFYCSMEPATTTIIVSNDEPVQAEPELVAEEFEETVSSKVFINYEEAPDVSTVNHVTSYTISEKAHFKTPRIESLPQQMQYYFLLV